MLGEAVIVGVDMGFTVGIEPVVMVVYVVVVDGVVVLTMYVVTIEEYI
jgi:hypothetical protein